MMRLMIVTYVQKIKYYHTAPRTGTDTKNTKAAENCVPAAQVSINAREAKTM